MTCRARIIFALCFQVCIVYAAIVGGRSSPADIVHNAQPRRRLELTQKQIRRKERRKEKRLQAKAALKQQQQQQTLTSSPAVISSEPSNLPTKSPTTSSPTPIPSAPPTTAEPSARPTTLEPTAYPSPSPTTAEPSTTPTTWRPTASPSAKPTTASPSMTPTTNKPTPNPSITPSHSPTLHISSSPSTLPSYTPTTPLPSSTPSTEPSQVQTRISCSDEDMTSSIGLSLAIIRFKYEVAFKPSITEADAISFAETSVAQAIADKYLQCTVGGIDRKQKLDGGSFELLAVDSRPTDTVSNTDACTVPDKPKWGCAVVYGAVTTFSEENVAVNVNEIIQVIEQAALTGSLSLPNGKSSFTYIPPEPLQQAPPSPFTSVPDAYSPTSNAPKFVYGVAVAAAFLGSVAIALFLYYRYRRPIVMQRLQADSEGNVQPLDDQGLPLSDAGSDQGASYLSDDTFWKTIMSKGPTSNNRAHHIRQESSSDASVGLSSIGVSFTKAFGIEDDIDIESCGSGAAADDPYLQDDLHTSTTTGDGKDRKWLDRLGIFADPK